MPVLDRSNCNSQAGWIDYDDGGVIEYGFDHDGEKCCAILRVGSPAWNTLGNQRRRKQVAQAGDIIRVRYYFAGAGPDFVFGVRRSAGLDIATTTGIYNNGSGKYVMLENNTTPAPDVAPASVGWVDNQFIFNADGTITMLWYSVLSPVWTTIGTTAANDWIGKDVYFSDNCYMHGNQGGSFVDDLLWTRA